MTYGEDERRGDRFEPRKVLTPYQERVMHLVAEGFSNAEIAQRFGITEKSLENTISTIYQRVGIGQNKAHNRRVVAVREWLAYLERSTDGGVEP